MSGPINPIYRGARGGHVAYMMQNVIEGSEPYPPEYERALTCGYQADRPGCIMPEILPPWQPPAPAPEPEEPPKPTPTEADGLIPLSKMNPDYARRVLHAVNHGASNHALRILWRVDPHEARTMFKIVKNRADLKRRAKERIERANKKPRSGPPY